MSHWQSKTTIRPTDRKFSIWVRTRDGRCVFNVKCTSYVGVKGLHCCHFWSRRHESVRFDPENADAGCPACHDWIDSTAEGEKWHDTWKLNQLGQRAYDLLELRQQSKGTRDDYATKIVLKEMLRLQEIGRREEERRYGSLA